MSAAPLVVLGASGNTGRVIARLLLERTQERIVLAGRNPDRLVALAALLGRSLPAGRLGIVRADAGDAASLRGAFAGARMVVNASSTAAHTATLARACLDAGADWLDVVVSAGKLRVLRELEQEIVRAGRCFITDGGFHPGLPAALVRAVAPEFETLHTALVHSVIQVDWRDLAFARSTTDEFMEEIVTMEMDCYRDGRWRAANWLSGADFPVVDFGPPFGRRQGAPMRLEEMRALPGLYPTLRATGFYVGGFNWFVDWLVFPVAAVALRVAPRRSRAPVSALMLWGLRRFSRPPFGTLLRVVATGERGGTTRRAELQVSHPNGYVFTALPVVSCIEQYLEGTLAKPGLWLQALVVDPPRLLRDLAAMGAVVQRVSDG